MFEFEVYGYLWLLLPWQPQLGTDLPQNLMLFPIPLMLHMTFDEDWPTGLGDVLVGKCGRQRNMMDNMALLYCMLTMCLRLKWAKIWNLYRYVKYSRNIYLNKLYCNKLHLVWNPFIWFRNVSFAFLLFCFFLSFFLSFSMFRLIEHMCHIIGIIIIWYSTEGNNAHTCYKSYYIS